MLDTWNIFLQHQFFFSFWRGFCLFVLLRFWLYMPKQNQKQSVFFHENLKSWEILWAVSNEKYWYFLYYWKTSNLNHASALKEFAYLMLTKAHRTTRLEPVGWMFLRKSLEPTWSMGHSAICCLILVGWVPPPPTPSTLPLLFVRPHLMPCGISVTWPGIEPLHPVPEVQIVNHLTSGVPVLPLLITDNENWLPQSVNF